MRGSSMKFVRQGLAGATVVALVAAGAISFAGANAVARKAPVATYNAAAAKLVPKSVKSKSSSGRAVEAFRRDPPT